MDTLETEQPARHTSPTARASALSYLIFERPDLERAEDFLADFGLVPAARTKNVLYMRGTVPAPYCYRVHRAPAPRFVGAGFVVHTRHELQRLARVEGASRIEPSEHPGGGARVVLSDPSGFRVEVVHDQAPAEAIPARAPLVLNVGGEQNRVDEIQRAPVEPPEVIKLGHVVLEVADFQATCGWYTQHLGLVPSDVQILPDGSPAVTFLRLDLGDTPADHHTLAIGQGLIPAFGHAAFEVVDMDAVGMGHRVLRERRRKHAWGIGRHILGSQIFDYWHDPWGDKHEHYCDGDLFTADRPMGVYPVSRDAMSQWGEPMPRSFTSPRITPAAVLATARSVRRSPDLTLQKVLALGRIFA